jgi:hypothetical protein
VVNSSRHPKEFLVDGGANVATADATTVCQKLGLLTRRQKRSFVYGIDKIVYEG